MADKRLPAIAKPELLNKRQKAFVLAMIDNGGDTTQAALTAGYCAKNARAAGYAVWRSAIVQESYKAAIWDMIASGAGVATKALLQIAKEAESDHAKILAAKELLNRAGFISQQMQNTGNAITINIGLPRDTGATQPIDVSAESVEITDINEDAAHD